MEVPAILCAWCDVVGVFNKVHGVEEREDFQCALAHLKLVDMIGGREKRGFGRRLWGMHAVESVVKVVQDCWQVLGGLRSTDEYISEKEEDPERAYSSEEERCSTVQTAPIFENWRRNDFGVQFSNSKGGSGKLANSGERSRYAPTNVGYANYSYAQEWGTRWNEGGKHWGYSAGAGKGKFMAKSAHKGFKGYTAAKKTEASETDKCLDAVDTSILKESKMRVDTTRFYSVKVRETQENFNISTSKDDG